MSCVDKEMSVRGEWKRGFAALQVQWLKHRLAKACRLLYRMGLVAHAEGNVSCRVGNDRFLIKITGTPFRAMKPENFVLIDEEGDALTQGEPSTEKPLHLEIYRSISDINFTIHTHPSNVIKVSRMSTEFFQIPKESHAFSLTGDIPIVGPFPAGSKELADAAAKALKKANVRAVILRDHGLVVASPELEEAFDLTVFIEKVASEKEWSLKHKLEKRKKD